jgi:transcriptional regulator with XRE-family HTH domain
MYFWVCKSIKYLNTYWNILQKFKIIESMNDKTFKKLIGERIRYYRKINRLTQEELAEIMDFNTKSISLLENGHNYIALNKVPKLCSALKIKPYKLFIFDKRNCLLEDVQSDIIDLLSTMDKKKLKLAYKLLYELNDFTL